MASRIRPGKTASHGEPDTNVSSLRYVRPLLGCILALYLTLSLHQLDLPGLHYDEAFEAVPALQLLQNQPVTAFRSSGLVINGRTFPFMTQDYIGALNTYLALPFIYLSGPTPAALRLMSIIAGVITVWLAYLLARRLTGSAAVGLAASLLLAVDPTFVFWTRQGIFVTAVTAPIGLAAVLCWLRWLETRSLFWAAAGSFFFGLGLYAKFLFIWLVAALFGLFVLFYLLSGPRRERLVIPTRHSRLRSLVVMGLAFLAGCWPLLIYNLQTRGTWLSITQNAGTSFYGVNNLAFGANLLERIQQFLVLLAGSHLWYLGQVVNNVFPPLLFSLVFVFVVLISTRRVFVEKRDRYDFISGPPATGLTSSQAVLFPFLVICLVILASIGTVSALWITHFAILLPWPAIAIAAGGWYIRTTWTKTWQLKTGRVWLPVLLWTGWGLLVMTQLGSTIQYHLALTKSGGLSSHSDAIYDLSRWLDSQPPGPVVAMDWGLAAPVTYLTGGRVTPVEIFGYAWQSKAELSEQLERFIAQPAALYLWRAPDEIIFDRSREFKALYRPLRLEETIEAAFYENSGRPLLGVTRLVPCGAAGINAPDPSPYCSANATPPAP